LKTNFGLGGDVGLELLSLDFDIDLRLKDADKADIPRLAGSCKCILDVRISFEYFFDILGLGKFVLL
jgi:hypothetical protein